MHVNAEHGHEHLARLFRGGVDVPGGHEDVLGAQSLGTAGGGGHVAAPGEQGAAAKVAEATSAAIA